MELWRDVAEAAQAKGGAQSVTTAQVLNLVIRAVLRGREQLRRSPSNASRAATRAA